LNERERERGSREKDSEAMRRPGKKKVTNIADAAFQQNYVGDRAT
jgi:hypothetical protein